MQELKNEELLNIIGGVNWTGVIVNALTGAAKFVYSIGQAFGSSVRRISNNNLCPLK